MHLLIVFGRNSARHLNNCLLLAYTSGRIYMRLAEVKHKLLRINLWVKFSEAAFDFIAGPNLLIAESQSITLWKNSSIFAGLWISKDSAAGKGLRWVLGIMRGLLSITLYSLSPQMLTYTVVLTHFLSPSVLKRPQTARACRLPSWPLLNGACDTQAVPLLPSVMTPAPTFSSEQPSVLLKLNYVLDFHIFCQIWLKLYCGYKMSSGRWDYVIDNNMIV